MDNAAVAIFLGVVVAVFIVGGLVWAFIADRNRNEDVAHDPERVEPDPTAPVDHSDRSDRPGG